MNTLIAAYQSAKLFWYDEAQTIIYVVGQRGWRWQDTPEIFVRINTEIDRNQHPTYVIIDMSKAGMNVPRGKDFGIVRQLITDDPFDEMMTIFVTNSRILPSLVEMVMSIYRKDIADNSLRFVETLTDALKIVAFHQDRVLPHIAS